MKKILLSLFFAAAAVSLFAQTKDNQIDISIGGGLATYRSDLNANQSAHSFTFKPYVFKQISFNKYLNASFDLISYATYGRSPDQTNFFSNLIDIVQFVNEKFYLTTFGLGLKYKLTNGKILPSNYLLSPHFFLGVDGSRLTYDNGIYREKSKIHLAESGGMGITYYFAKHWQVAYDLRLGRVKSNWWSSLKNDYEIYVQNAIMLGFNF